MKVSVQAAQSNLSNLIDAALAGEEVVVEREGEQAVKLVPVVFQNGFRFGLLKGLVTEVPDFFEPMSEEELVLWEGGP